MIPSIPPVSWADTCEYVVLAGSHGYGTAIEISDRDLRGFFMPCGLGVLGFLGEPDSRVTDRLGIDDAFWEFRKFFRLCAAANPNVIETLFLPATNMVRGTEAGMAVREIRQAFLSRRIGRTYLGYATGNYKRIQNVGAPELPCYDPKDAMHLIRLVRTGLEALRTGDLRVQRPEDRDYFLSIRRGEVPFEKIRDEFEAARVAWPAAEAGSPLPAVPDERALNEYCASFLGLHVRDRW